MIGAFYRVYNQLDYGFLESIYVESLSRVLQKKGHTVEREVAIVVYFEGEAVGLQRVDMIVDSWTRGPRGALWPIRVDPALSAVSA